MSAASPSDANIPPTSEGGGKGEGRARAPFSTEGTAPATVTLLTPHAPGAVAALQLSGDIAPILEQLTGSPDWPVGQLRLASIAGIDDGLVVRIRGDIALLMPHGGVRIVHQIAEAAVARGARLIRAADAEPRDVFPEAADGVEALMLSALARAESPLAIDLLLDQPRRWRAKPALNDDDLARSQRLNRLLEPPLVVLAGLPNVGKSTLTNTLAGRALSITADMPGTTRDYTAGRLNIAGLVVDWHDTPGMRASADPIEQRSVEIARRLLERADLIITMAAPPEFTWPDLPRPGDLHVVNKCDLQHDAADFPGKAGAIHISARAGINLSQLAATVREALVPAADLQHPGPWLFDRRLTTA